MLSAPHRPSPEAAGQQAHGVGSPPPSAPTPARLRPSSQCSDFRSIRRPPTAPRPRGRPTAASRRPPWKLW